MKQDPTLLAIETSTDACSVALLHNGTIISRHEIAPREHVRIVLPLIEELITQAGIVLQNCDAIAFGRGPGSFTGLRIAASIAQGLAFGAQLPVISVSSLQILAQTAVDTLRNEDALLEKKTILVINDARMQEVYWNYYQITNGSVTALNDDSLDPPAKVQLTENLDYAVGNGWTNYATELAHLAPKIKNILPIDYPNATALLQLAKQEFLRGNVKKAEEALPVYIRDKVTHS
jgi:tRNA threonylcarbamoyladenosine biosynthesis protein TsaB